VQFRFLLTVDVFDQSASPGNLRDDIFRAATAVLPPRSLLQLEPILDGAPVFPAICTACRTVVNSASEAIDHFGVCRGLRELEQPGSSTRQCARHPRCYKPDGHRPPCERWGGLACGPLPGDIVHAESPKSALWWLMGPEAFWRERPPYLVVGLWGMVGWLWLAFMLLKLQAS
jgi:hypothetical protein